MAPYCARNSDISARVAHNSFTPYIRNASEFMLLLIIEDVTASTWRTYSATRTTRSRLDELHCRDEETYLTMSNETSGKSSLVNKDTMPWCSSRFEFYTKFARRACNDGLYLMFKREKIARTGDGWIPMRKPTPRIWRPLCVGASVRAQNFTVAGNPS